MACMQLQKEREMKKTKERERERDRDIISGITLTVLVVGATTNIYSLGLDIFSTTKIDLDRGTI